MKKKIAILLGLLMLSGVFFIGCEFSAACRTCGGTGICTACRGDGCTWCKGTGKCFSCDGTGKD